MLGSIPLSVRAPGGSIAWKRDWYRDFDLPMEAERGLDQSTDHLCVGEATLPLVPGEWRGIVASLDPEPPSDLAAATASPSRSRPCSRIHALQSSPAMCEAPAWIARLTLAADAFLFSRAVANRA